MPKKSVVGTKAVKIKHKRAAKVKDIYYSDDDVPDEENDKFYKDDIDLANDEIDDDSEDDRTIAAGVPQVDAPDKEAVYDFSDSEDEEEMEARLREIQARVRRHKKKAEDSDSTSEDEDDDEDTEYGMKAWGKKREDFYGADIGAKIDLGVSSDDDDEAGDAKLEEREALLLQKKIMSQIDEADYDLSMFAAPPEQEKSKTSSIQKEVIVADVSSLSKRDKLRLLKSEYPEMINLLQEYKAGLIEYKDKLSPIIGLHKKNIISDSQGLQLLKYKGRILLSYCSCIQFYLLLRAEKSPVEGHPVVKRMVHFKQLLKDIGPVEEKLKSQIDYLLEKISAGAESSIRLARAATTRKQQKKKVRIAVPEEKMMKTRNVSQLLDDDSSEGEDPGATLQTDGEREALEFYNMMKARKADAQVDQDSEGDEKELTARDNSNKTLEEISHEKRAVTNQIKKNRGLTPSRNKAKKNPRVKHRMKYQRAKTVHKSYVPEARTEMSRYDGEASGIRASRIRSVKIKS